MRKLHAAVLSGLFSMLFITQTMNASYACPCAECPCCDEGCWYGVVATGTAYTSNTGISNPDTNFWDPAAEGYNSDLGYAPYFSLGFGRNFGCFAVDLTYTYFQTFHYQKHQTSSFSVVPGFSGLARTRFFDLDARNFMVNLSYYPRWCALSFCSVNIAPFAGLGLGVGLNRVHNFHTVGFDPISAMGSTTAIGESVHRASFAAQGTAGLRIQPLCTPLNFDLAYRYYYGGRFSGPSSVVLNTDTGLGLSTRGSAWEGSIKANCFYLGLTYCF